MRLGVMQPYFFPYIGYWQLINAVDTYVIYDDVNYKKCGWINRNRIMINGECNYFSLIIHNASQNKLIKDLDLKLDKRYNDKLLRKIEYSFKQAPEFKRVFPILEEIIMLDDSSLSEYLETSIRMLCQYLSIDTHIIKSSSLDKDQKLKGQDKILDICKVLEADEYINLIGGLDLYSSKKFVKNNVKLKFLKPKSIKYGSYKEEYIPNLSIIDIMMFNSTDQIQEMLEAYELVMNS